MDQDFIGKLAPLAGRTKEALAESIMDGEGKLKENAAEIFSNLVLDKFKSQEREKVDQHYHRGIKERSHQIAKALNSISKKYGVDVNRDDIESSLEELSEKLGDAGGQKGDPQEMTAEQIAKLPAFKGLLDEKTTEVVNKWQEKYNALEQQHNDFKNTTNRERIASTVYSRTRKALEKDERVPIYGAKGADEAIKMFWAYHNLDNIKLDESGNPQPVNSEGNVLRDNMSNPISFDSFIENNWILGFKTAAGNGSPPHGRGGGGDNTPQVKDREAFNTAINNASTKDEKVKLLRARAAALRENES